MSTAWSHLPNAHHIDWVLASLNKNPELWDAAWSAAWSAARDSAWHAGIPAARAVARDTAWKAAWSAAKSAAKSAAVVAAKGVIAALVAYDDCDDFLNMSYEKLKIWAILSEDRRAIFLLPMVYVKEKLKISIENVT